MTLTRAPVEAESSVTELSFLTQMSVLSAVMAHGSTKAYLEPRMILTRAPVEADSSVTELSFVTQM